MSKESTNSELASNRRARHDFEILDTFEAGIVLRGTEIKSLRDGGGSLQEAYVKILKGELWLIGAHISPYRFGNVHNHEERRDRKLLMHSYEIRKLRVAIQEKGLTIVPLALYLQKGRVKIKIAVGRGKKTIDKREAIKERDEKKRMEKAVKHYL